MLIDKIGSNTIERYASIDEVPVDRFMTFNRFVFLDSGVGADQESIDVMDKKLLRLIRQGKNKEAEQLVKNRNLAVNWVFQNIHPGLMSYVPLIKSINGRDLYDYSDDACQRILGQLGKMGATKGFIQKIVEFSKKKFQEEIDILMPDRPNRAELSEQFGKRKKRLLLILEKLINPEEDITEELEKIEEFIFGLLSVKSYSGIHGEEAKFIKNYKEMSFIIAQNGSVDPMTMTASTYLQALKSIKKQAKDSKKREKRFSKR